MEFDAKVYFSSPFDPGEPPWSYEEEIAYLEFSSNAGVPGWLAELPGANKFFTSSVLDKYDEYAVLHKSSVDIPQQNHPVLSKISIRYFYGYSNGKYRRCRRDPELVVLISLNNSRWFRITEFGERPKSLDEHSFEELFEGVYPVFLQSSLWNYFTSELYRFVNRGLAKRIW